MKSIFSFCFYLTVMFSTVFAGKANAHNYVPFLMDSTNWRVHIYFFQFALCEEEYVVDYYFTGDTIINNINYKKIRGKSALYMHRNGSYNCSYLNNFYSELYLRQDTLNRQVYQMQVGDSTEKLLYDFNLNAGDTLFDSKLVFDLICQNNNFAIVQSIDSQTKCPISIN